MTDMEKVPSDLSDVDLSTPESRIQYLLAMLGVVIVEAHLIDSLLAELGAFSQPLVLEEKESMVYKGQAQLSSLTEAGRLLQTIRQNLDYIVVDKRAQSKSST